MACDDIITQSFVRPKMTLESERDDGPRNGQRPTGHSRLFRKALILVLMYLPTAQCFQSPAILARNNHQSISQGVVKRSRESPLNAVAPIILPSIQTVAASCLLPTSLGFIKSEYGFSYGYGASVALVAGGVFRASTTITALPMTTASWHALALLFYGVRLNTFLLHRELFIPRFREMRDRIEQRATSRESSRLSRIPIVISCAILYACLSAPLFVTVTATIQQHSSQLVVVQALVGCTWAGFLVNAVGDLQKAIGKARRGDDALVTGGILKYLRHPNYTGEAFAWSSSFGAALVAAVSAGWKRHLPALMVASAVGLVGILLVLGKAASSLEKRQEEKYGDTDEYKSWIQGSWVGIAL